MLPLLYIKLPYVIKSISGYGILFFWSVQIP